MRVEASIVAAEKKVYCAVTEVQQGEPHLNKHISICTLPTGELSSESDKINE